MDIEQTASKISLPFVDIERQKVTKKISHYLELKETHIHWLYEAQVQIKNEDNELWNDELLFYDTVAKRQFIVAVELSWRNLIEAWRVTIYIAGIDGDINIYFKNQSGARDLVKTLNKYIL